MNEVLRAIEKRSSTRAYTEEKLTKEQLDALLHAGLRAPTAANRQEFHITVVDGSNPLLAEIEEAKCQDRGIPAPQFNFCFDAPTVLFLSADSSFPWGTLDCGIAVENIALAAEGMGLGSLIIGCIKGAMCGEKKAYFAEKLRLPEGYDFEIAIALGHKATEKTPHTYDMDKQVSYV